MVQIQTKMSPTECVEVFQRAVQKRPMKLKIFPFKCAAPQVSSSTGSISASFQLAEPYGMLAMVCEVRGGETIVSFSTDGNIRGKITANSLAKHVAAQLA